MNSDIGGDVYGLTTKNGYVVRYNARTNEFASGTPNGIIETLFRPKEGLAYWLAQVSKYGQ